MPPKLKGLQHIGIRVRDLEKSVAFYTDILCFRTVDRYRYDKPHGQRIANNFITCTDQHHVINLTQNAPEFWPENPPPPEDTRRRKEFGIHHMAFESEDRETFEAWLAHLGENGIEFTAGPVVHSPAHPEGDGLPGENRAVYFSDPDGNSIEIFCDMGLTEDGGAAIRADWFRDRLRRDGYDLEGAPLPEPHL